MEIEDQRGEPHSPFVDSAVGGKNDQNKKV